MATAKTKAKGLTSRVLERLRLKIQRSGITQRAVEERGGFSRGYLSQLFGGAVELKYWHVLAILYALEVEPSEFFGELFPRRRHPALESLDEVVADRSEESSLSFELARLFASGVETIGDLSKRVGRCEAAIEELTGLGLLRKREGGLTE